MSSQKQLIKKKFYGHRSFPKVLIEMIDLHNDKSHDYGGKDDPVQNLRPFGWKGIVVRLGDKFFRMKNFIEQGEVKFKEENIRDTMIDMAVYSVLMLCLYDEERELNDIGKQFKSARNMDTTKKVQTLRK